MPRILKFSTDGIIDDIPDFSLQVIEHTALFYIIDTRIQNKMNKYIAFAVAGGLYEYYIDMLKKQDANKNSKK